MNFITSRIPDEKEGQVVEEAGYDTRSSKCPQELLMHRGSLSPTGAGWASGTEEEAEEA